MLFFLICFIIRAVIINICQICFNRVEVIPMKKILTAAFAACLVLSAASLSVLAHGGHHGGWNRAPYTPAAQTTAVQPAYVCASGYTNCPYVQSGVACPGHSATGHGCSYDNCLYANAQDCEAHHYACPYGYGCTSASECHHSLMPGYGYGYGCGGCR